MKKNSIQKQIVFIICILIGVTAVAVGGYFFFRGSKSIDEVPQTLSIEKMSNDFYLVSDVSDKYQFQFSLEQEVDGEYRLLQKVNSQTNSIKLQDQKFDIVAGEKYRFCVAFTTEKGAIVGKNSNYITWQPVLQLNEIDYPNVRYNKETSLLSWIAINNAEGYSVRLVDRDANVLNIDTTQNFANLGNIAPDKYKLFISAKSNDLYTLNSGFGDGIDFVLSKENQILSANVSENKILTVTCSQKIKTFDLYLADDLKAQISPENVQKVGENFVYTLNIEILGDDLTNLKIKSQQNGYVLESKLFEI